MVGEGGGMYAGIVSSFSSWNYLEAEDELDCKTYGQSIGFLLVIWLKLIIFKIVLIVFYE